MSTISPPTKRSRPNEETIDKHKSILDADTTATHTNTTTTATHTTTTNTTTTTTTTTTTRQNQEKNNANGHILSTSLFSKTDTLRNLYFNAKPYNHGLIHNFCINGFLNQVVEELKQNSKVKFKESDLFRVYQSIDLGNLTDQSPIASQIPSLMRLKQSLYSQQFRHFMEQITGLDCGILTEQVDCAANCHTQGCHLLCHDDVIGNRKVSFILYLTDPDYQWSDEDGGRLELYESMDSHDHSNQNKGNVPKPFPSKTILPIFNSLAYFVVSPGQSFHSVQEVFSDHPRLTIQGWYHTKDPPSHMEHATLSRLKSSAKGEDTEGPFLPLIISPIPSSTTTKNATNTFNTTHHSTLSNSDRTFLSNFINQTYLTNKAIDDIRHQFEDDSSVQLRHFLNPEWATKIKTACLQMDANHHVGKGNPSLNYNIGVGNGWKAVGPAHKQRFLEYDASYEIKNGNDNSDNHDATNDDTPNASAGALLKYIQSHLFQSDEFGRLLRLLSSLGVPKGIRGKVRRFRPGLDYTVAHYGILTMESVLDATLCFVAGNGFEPTYQEEEDVTETKMKQEKEEEEGGGGEEEMIESNHDILWTSGDVGGFECYIAATDENDYEEEMEAEDKYDADNDTELLSVSACNNTLSLVYRDPGTMRFVKYVGSQAPSSRWDLSLEYEMEIEDEDEDENEQNNDGTSTT